MNIDSHIAQLLERIGEVSRALRTKQAQDADISPLQLRILGFIGTHKSEGVGVARLAEELQLTRPTISDSVKTLEARDLIKRKADKHDGRSHSLHLTPAGRKLIKVASPLKGASAQLSSKEKDALLLTLMQTLESLFHDGGLHVQRMCWTCTHYRGDRKKKHHCNLLEMDLAIAELRTDCAEHVLAE